MLQLESPILSGYHTAINTVSPIHPSSPIPLLQNPGFQHFIAFTLVYLILIYLALVSRRSRRSPTQWQQQPTFRQPRLQRAHSHSAPTPEIVQGKSVILLHHKHPKP